MQSLRAEADAAVARAEEAEAKNKKYEQLLLEKEQEITSLQHKVSVLDADLEKAEAKLADLKAARAELVKRGRCTGWHVSEQGEVCARGAVAVITTDDFESKYLSKATTEIGTEQ